MNIGIGVGIPQQQAVINGATRYYTDGMENVTWVDGALLGDPTVRAKNTNHLYIKAENLTTLTVGTYVTDLVVDLTKINTLYIEWENTGTASGNNVSYLVASTVKGGNYGSFNAQLEVGNTFAKNIKTLNVSALTGNYYLRTHARANAVGIISELKVYRVWGEA